MKKKIMMSIVAVFVLALGMFAFAFTPVGPSLRSSVSCCCCSGDSCPLKKKDANGNATASCCDNCDCCKGDSCPMKKKDASQTSASGDTEQPATTGKAKHCDCSCCKHEKEKQDVPTV